MKKILFSPPDISQKEINYVIETLKSGWITTGPKTKEFERKISKYCGTKKSICMNSATACLESALRILGVGPGDEVIVPSYTYTASCSVICHVGATPIMVDLSENSLEMDYNKVFDLINCKTKAIIPVDIGGILCDYERIFEIVNSQKTKFRADNELQEKIGRVCIISDSAHAFGATRNSKISGSIADFTAFSFHAVKNLVTAEGGALTWTIDDDDLYKKLSLISLHGQNKDALAKMNPSDWEYDIVCTGYKNNMTDILASIGLAQLERFESLIEKRRKLASLYNSYLRDSSIQIYQEDSKLNDSTVHLYITNIKGKNENFRNTIINKMAQMGIATNVHYKPLPLLTAYKNLGFDISDYPNAYNLFKNEISLPLYSTLTDEEVDYIIENLLEVLKEY